MSSDLINSFVNRSTFLIRRCAEWKVGAYLNPKFFIGAILKRFSSCVYWSYKLSITTFLGHL